MKDKIINLIIDNGVEFNSTQVTEINGQTAIANSSNYASVTHAWTLSEATGSTFTALKGGINASGTKTT